jgi:hypothetical protein
MSKLLTGAGAYIVLTFALAFIWNMLLFRDKYTALASESLRDNPIMPLGFVAIVIQALILATLFSKFSDGSMQQGLLLALGVGAFSITYGAFVVPAKFAIAPVAHYAALELLFGVIHYSAIGVALTYVFRKA